VHTVLTFVDNRYLGTKTVYNIRSPYRGAVAQLGERFNGIEEDIEYEESPDMERQREQDQDVAPLAEQAEELAEEEVPVDGTAEERIAALEERVAELTELIRELTEALQPN